MKTSTKATLGLSFAIAIVAAHTPARADLFPRLNGQAYYNDALDITWLANANSGFAPWLSQVAWAENLSVDGVTGWRLPSMDVNGDGVVVECLADLVACVDNEMAYLYFVEGITINAPGPFTNISNQGYFSSTDVSVDNPNDAWLFSFAAGFQGGFTKLASQPAWAVRSGDVGAAADTDEDGVPDEADNCVLVANADQLDTDTDGIGNACDADLNNDCAVNFGDLATMKAAFFPNPYNPVADFNGDGFVNFGDLAFMKSTFFNGSNPGPGPAAPGNDCE